MSLRDRNIVTMQSELLDTLVIGGGINGAVSAAAIAGKSGSVALIDKGDFAGFTSSNSSNLAWGGVKYLESNEFGLVNKLCKSRNHLMNSYPSSVREVRFLASIQKGFRFHPLFIYMGTLLYWGFGRFFTQAPEYLSVGNIGEREPAIKLDSSIGGFEYSDAYLFDNDARFVFNFIRTAMDAGCAAANYVSAVSSEFRDGVWVTQAQDQLAGQTFEIRSKTLINAAGPYVDRTNQTNKEVTAHHHVFSKGVHLIVDQITKVERVLTFFASDGRLFFVIPMGQKTCIGTTDTQVPTPESHVTDEDRDFILANANSLLNLDAPLTREDIISERCGVRPLAIEGQGGKADWVQLSRKHAIDVNESTKHLSIFGGKLTDCINVGEEVAEIISGFGVDLVLPSKWYGEPPEVAKLRFMEKARMLKLDDLTDKRAYEPLSKRFWRRYGNAANGLLDEIKYDPSLAEIALEHTEYTWAEIHYIAEKEMVVELEDFLRRRAKISLVTRRDAIRNARGLDAVCKVLFGERAEQCKQRYFS